MKFLACVIFGLAVCIPGMWTAASVGGVHADTGTSYATVTYANGGPSFDPSTRTCGDTTVDGLLSFDPNTQLPQGTGTYSIETVQTVLPDCSIQISPPAVELVDPTSGEPVSMASADAATDPVDPPQTLQPETDCSLPCAGADSDGEPTHGACPSASYCNAHVVQTEYDCCNIRLTELRSYLWYDNVQHKAAAGSSDYTHKEADICLPPTCVTTGWYRTAQSYSFHGGCISNTDPCLHYNQYDSFKYIGEFDPTGLLYWTKYWNDLYSHYKTYQWSCHWKYEFQGAPGFKFFQHCWVTLH